MRAVSGQGDTILRRTRSTLIRHVRPPDTVTTFVGALRNNGCAMGAPVTDRSGLVPQHADMVSALAALAGAVESKIADAARSVIERWMMVRPDSELLDAADGQVLINYCDDASAQVCRLLRTGERITPTGATEETGARIAGDTFALADSLKLFLMWRDSLLDAFLDESVALELPREVFAQAEMAVRRAVTPRS